MTEVSGNSNKNPTVKVWDQSKQNNGHNRIFILINSSVSTWLEHFFFFLMALDVA